MKTWSAQTSRICRNYVFTGSLSLAFLIGIVGCGSSTTAPTGTNTGSTASASGLVQSYVSFSHSKKNARKNRQAHTSNDCASAACTTLVVGSGGGGTAGPSCTVDGSGNFTVSSVPVGEQLEANFACTGGTQSCIVMSGDSGVTCDPVAAAVIQAFLNVMGISSLADASLAHANIAQIAHSIDQAAQTGTTAAETFLNAISACSSTACDLAAIKASPFYGPFRLMKTQVTGWDVESIYTLLTDVMGYQVQIDSLTYTPFGTAMDTWLSTNFIGQTKTFVNAMLRDQASNGNTYVTEIVCQMQYNKYMGGGTITYYPTFSTIDPTVPPTCASVDTATPTPDTSTALASNGFSPSQVTAINNAYNSGSGGGNQIDVSVGSVGCSAYQNPAFFCVNTPQLVILTKASEPNRNDPLGTNDNNFIQSTQVSMIDVFPAVQTALMNLVSSPSNVDTTGASTLSGHACLEISGGGSPTVYNDTYCMNWFGTQIAPYKNDFAGAMGLYMALKNNSLGANSLMSLNDLYTIFHSANFLGMKLTDQSNYSWGVNFTPASGSGNYGMNSLLNDPSPTSSYTGAFTLDPLFFNSNNATPLTNAQAVTLYTSADYGYNDSFQLFETIPTASTVHDYVFKSAYHVDYNPTGGSTYYASGGTAAATGTLASDPIFCQMTLAGALVEVDMAQNPGVTVKCRDAATLGVQVSTTGVITPPADFQYPYVLSQWGYQGDSAGALFMLVDWQTGFQIQPNGHQQFVYQKSAGNPNSVCVGGSDTNSVVSTNISMGNGSSSSSQLITAYCMDMSTSPTNFASSSYLGFYFAGNMQLPSSDPNCPGCSMGVGVVGGLNTTVSGNYSTPPVCVFAPSTALTVTSNVAVAGSGGVVINGSGQITSIGNLLVDYCSATHDGDTSYQLITIPGPAATADTDLYAELLPSGGTPLLWEAIPTTGSPTVSDYYLTVNASVLSAEFASTNSSTTTVYRVAPLTPPTQVQGITLANPSWEPKFDPFCDSREGDGLCHCLDGTTSAAKSGSACTLEDTPTDSTMSNPPYNVFPGMAAPPAPAFFADYQGKAGSQLVDLGGTGLNYTSTNWTGSGGASVQSLNMNFQQVFVCQYLATSETTYRSPQMLSNNWSHTQPGCPDSTGTIAAWVGNSDQPGAPPGSTPSTGGGPIRLVYPVPMNNAYAVLTPNAAVKVINYATKDTGQGVTIDPTKKIFTFDTGLALMAFRNQFPLTNITVTLAGGNTPVPGPLGAFQQVQNPATSGDNNNDNLGPVGSVLCYLGNNGNACTSHHGQRLLASFNKGLSHMTHQLSKKKHK